MRKKIRVRYTAHDKNQKVTEQQADFWVSDEVAASLMAVPLPKTREEFPPNESCFNLKMALYWSSRLIDRFFDMNDSVQSIRELSK